MVGGGSQYTTIQQGIQAAEHAGSHSVVVTAGTYTENVTLSAADNGLSITTNGTAKLAGSIGITGGSGITVSGLTFQGDGSTTAITALNSSAITISDDSFLGTGQAVVLDGTTNSTVADNLMTNTTNSAIEAKNGANGNVIDSNVINGDGAPNTAGAIWLHGSNQTSITHNAITNTAGAGISLGDFFPPGSTATQNNNDTIAYNTLNQVDQQSLDSGAIYILGRSQEASSNDLVQMNFIGATGSAGAQAVSLYLDDNASGVTITQNIVQGTAAVSHGYEIHGGSNDTITGNIFDLGPGEPGDLPVYGLTQSDSAGQTPQGSFASLQNDITTGNIFLTENPSPRNPGFADLTNGIGSVTITNNDYWSYLGSPQFVTGSGAGGDTAAKFVQPSAQDPTTLAGYAAFSGDGIGFKAIDTTLIGLAPTGPHPY